MSKKPFEKFIKPELKGAKKKEAIRQEKRKLKEESRLRGEEYRKKEAEKYQAVGTKYGNAPEQRGKQSPAGSKQPAATGRFVKPDQFGSKDAALSTPPHKQPSTFQEMPLNKFIAHAGICGRREAAELVKEGKVTVNGDIIYEPGYKVMGNEDVKVNGKKIFSQKNLVYVLLNKPKDFLTTLKDPEGRKTVIDLVKAATKERIYPVGRLDRNTTGVLLLTNDGELAQKLTHPSFEVKKIYEVKLDKPVQKNDIEAILNGITLEDGLIKADAVSYVDPKDKSLVGIEIHSGRNRIVRRIFEHLGYDVRNLDRVMFANLTKKNVDRGKWRHLNEKEIRLLKFMNQSFVRAKKERSEAQDKQVDELLEQDKKPSRTATKPRVREEGTKERKRTYKEPTGEKRTAPAKTFNRPAGRNEGVAGRKKVYKDAGEARKPSTGKSFKPRSEKGTGDKRPYKSAATSKRPTDRRR
jgi:23S rRNA pseudouridine2605 synthase